MTSTNPTSVYELEPGIVYIVLKPFFDHHGGAFAAGDLLTFESRHFLPYHGGHTIIFREKGLYLQEDDQAEILDNLVNYLAIHDASGRVLQSSPPPLKKRANGFGTFLGSLCMLAATLFVWIVEKRAGFMVWAAIIFFGAAAVLNGVEWWTSRRNLSSRLDPGSH